MMNLPLELTIEQQFMMHNWKEQVGNLSRQDLEELLLETSRQLMIKNNIVKQLIKEKLI